MPTITLKNVPAELHAGLVERARLHKRSLNQEAIRCLESNILPTPADAEAFLARVRRSRLKLRDDGVPPLDDEFLARARQEARA